MPKTHQCLGCGLKVRSVINVLLTPCFMSLMFNYTEKSRCNCSTTTCADGLTEKRQESVILIHKGENERIVCAMRSSQV